LLKDHIIAILPAKNLSRPQIFTAIQLSKTATFEENSCDGGYLATLAWLRRAEKKGTGEPETIFSLWQTAYQFSADQGHVAKRWFYFEETKSSLSQLFNY
jgi:hypothetical protein